MRTLMHRLIFGPIAAAAFAATVALAQPPPPGEEQEPSLSEEQPPPQAPETITPTLRASPAPEAPGPYDPRSLSSLVHSLTVSLGLDFKQIAEMNKIIDAAIAEREKNEEDGRAILEKARHDVVKILTPEQKERAAVILTEGLMGGATTPGPGETGFRKWQPGRWQPGAWTPQGMPPGMMPPMMGRPDIARMMRQGLAAHADDIIRKRAAETLQLTPAQMEKVRKIESDKKTAVEQASKQAEADFRATLTKEQLTKYDAMRKRMKQRMEERFERPGAPDVSRTEKPPDVTRTEKP